MTLLELVRRLRITLDDEGGDTGVAGDGFSYYWEESDAGCLHKNLDLTRYINAARIELARRVPIRDRAESDATVIALEIGVSRYPFSERLLAIDEVLLESTGEPLTKIANATIWSRLEALGTVTETFDCVSQYRLDFDQRTLTVYDTPTVADALLLSVRRLPLVDLTWDDRENADAVEFEDDYSDALVDWAASLAFRRRDADTYNVELAGYHQGQFSDAVGPRIDFRHQRTLLDVSGTRLRSRAQYY